MKPTLPIASLVFCLALAPVAIAQQGPRPHNQFSILRHDANQDGQLTFEELDTALRIQFAERDADGDGVITQQERQAAMEAQRASAMARRFAALDANSDGSISADEFSARPDRPGLDRDVSGRIHGPRNAQRGPRPEQTNVNFEDFAASRITRFEKIDANADKVITQEELHAAAESRDRPRR